MKLNAAGDFWEDEAEEHCRQPDANDEMEHGKFLSNVWLLFFVGGELIARSVIASANES